MVHTMCAMNFFYPEQFNILPNNCPLHTARIDCRWCEERQDFDLIERSRILTILVCEWKIRNETGSDQLFQHVQDVKERIRRRLQLTYNINTSMQIRLQDADSVAQW